jgi:biopolymer transport protein ExbD
MADKKRFVDVWIVESNTVYKEVPFTVVIDWVQQGRLLEDDKVRGAGTKDWRRLGDVPTFAAYLPKAEPLRPQDQAEALEPVEFDFAWKKQHSDEDDEVDMIPLIDVSLVLLIFFMLTASGAGAAAHILIPPAENATVVNLSGIWIGINLEGDNKVPVYSLGEEGKESPDAADRDIRTKQELLQRFDAWLQKKSGPVDVTINAHKDVEDGLVLDLTVELSRPPRRHKIQAKFTGVTEKVQ